MLGICCITFIILPDFSWLKRHVSSLKLVGAHEKLRVLEDGVVKGFSAGCHGFRDLSVAMACETDASWRSDIKSVVVTRRVFLGPRTGKRFP